jgi:hypothetical protein
MEVPVGKIQGKVSILEAILEVILDLLVVHCSLLNQITPKQGQTLLMQIVEA